MLDHIGFQGVRLAGEAILVPRHAAVNDADRRVSRRSSRAPWHWALTHGVIWIHREEAVKKVHLLLRLRARVDSIARGVVDPNVLVPVIQMLPKRVVDIDGLNFDKHRVMRLLCLLLD